MKKTIFVTLLITITALLASCGGTSDASREESKSSGNSNQSTQEEISGSAEISENEQTSEDEYFSKYDFKTEFSSDDTTITLNGNTAVITGTGATVSDSIVTINAGGTYVISGTLDDGQIIVEITDEDKAHLVFNGVNISCSNSAPIWIKSGDKVSVTLAEGTENSLTDGVSYTFDNTDEEPNACLFSKVDLTINGTGSLTVTGKYNNGIGTKDDLRIISGTINVTAKNNAIKGNDSIAIKDGTITAKASDDGIKTTNNTDEGKGFIYIAGGSVTVTSGDDALQAEQSIIIKSGKVVTYADGDAVNCGGTIDIAVGCLTKN